MIAPHSFEIRVLAPISHGNFSSEDVGNAMLFRRMPIIASDGDIYQIPVISGNALRGVMRRLLAREYLQALGYKDDKFYITIANGGALNKSVDAYIRPQKIAEICETFPILSAFGSACYSFMLPGKLNMGFAVLQCSELGTGKIPSGDLVTDISQTRHIDRSEADYGDITPMPFVIEAVIQGAVFDCTVQFLSSATELDMACVFHGLNMIHSLGGKSAGGYGFVELSETFDDKPYLDWLEDIKQDTAYLDKAKKIMAEL